MSLKSSILNTVQILQEQNGGPIQSTDLVKYFDIQSSKFSSQMWTYSKDGLLKKTKDGGKNLYSISQKGRKFLKENPNVWNSEDLILWARGEVLASGQAYSESTNRRVYSRTADNAINSISDLVDTNERLMSVIRAIHTQLGLVLRDNSDDSEK